MKQTDIPFFANYLNTLFPDAKTELYYHNDFQLLIAILMSAQSTDKQVNKVIKIFFEHQRLAVIRQGSIKRREFAQRYRQRFGKEYQWREFNIFRK